ncbi:MAG: hypothetical protein RJA57_641 [Bacteroidota bacterium]|jgi:pullulanase
MKYIFLIMGMFCGYLIGRSQPPGYDRYPEYKGSDLGLTYTTNESRFRIWAPGATQVRISFYHTAEGDVLADTYPMQPDRDGTWVISVKGNLKGKFYTFSVFRDRKWSHDVPDPYARAVGVNGRRAIVIDLAETHPEGWQDDRPPDFKSKTDAIIYELHVRDASAGIYSGILNKGRFIGLTETGTRNRSGLSTGLDHLKELGVTHVHLLPVFDFNSIDERGGGPQYNWGYDPLNYNVPEGSYATDPYDGRVRIREFKQLVQAFHRNGLRVILDVVYNHTALTEDSWFNQLVPGYYYRQEASGRFSNATTCGNETASERPMFRKFMLESMLYWVREYHIDGFRIDLMGVHDIATVNAVSAALHRERPDILLYGEGWTAGPSPLPDSLRALKIHVARLDRVAVFSDDLRDGIKGSVFEAADRGFASGKNGLTASVRFGITAACPHPQVAYERVNYSRKPWASSPDQVISYAECHDNHILWDKLALSASSATREQRIAMHQLALSIVLTSQGIPFLHAGSEFLRTKYNDENSYRSPDSINAINWDLKSEFNIVYEYVRGLIRIRRSHPAFRMEKAAQIARYIHFTDPLPDGLIAYTINGAAVGDPWRKIWVCFNGNEQGQNVAAPNGTWRSAVRDNRVSTGSREPITRQVLLAPFSCSIFYQD